MMKVKTHSKEFVRPLRSGSKVQQNMKLPGPPPEKMPKPSPQVEDLSILKKAVDTNVTNPLEILKVFQGGTPEVIETMKNECSMIYECKVCRNLFRSIANFITHKRNYCTTKFSMPQQSNSNGDILEHSLIVGAVRGTVTTSRKTTRRDILSLLDNLQERIPESKQSHVFTEIPHTAAAVYNTTHSTPVAFKNDNSECSVVLGPTGHIIGSTQDGGATTDCKSCGETIRHMESHLSTCNSVFKQCFGCPLCEKYFTTVWAVYRHLRKLHGKNSEQVRKLRSLITKQELPVETKYKKQTIIMPTSTSSNSDKGWLEELEKNGVDGLYKCYICGKQFERRVALLSHTQACEKRKPSSVTEAKKTPASPREQQLSDKPSPAAIQMRVCYKKDGVVDKIADVCYKKDGIVDKIADCRVVATRLSDRVALAALSPESKEIESTNTINKASGPSVSNISTENLSNIDKTMDDTLQNHVIGSTHESDNEGNESETFQHDLEITQSEMIMNGGDITSYGMDGEDRVNHDSDFREDPSQDMFASQASFDGISRDYDEVVPPSVSESDIEIPPDSMLTNGFLPSPGQSTKMLESPLCPSPDKPCNGWNEPEANPVKDNFYSAFVDSNDLNDSQDVNENHNSLDTSLSNDEEDIEECDFDSLDVTRIICGSVKTDRRETDDEMHEEQEDCFTENSDKPTPSVSTEMSFDFEVVEHELEISSDESDSLNITLDPYISKTDSVCLLCYDKISDTRYVTNHVAEHLGVARYACGVPSCTVQTFARLDLIEHIRSDHMLESSSLIKTLKPEEIFTDDIPDFLGFDTNKDVMYSTYREFFGVLWNRYGISLPEDN